MTLPLARHGGAQPQRGLVDEVDIGRADGLHLVILQPRDLDVTEETEAVVSGAQPYLLLWVRPESPSSGAFSNSVSSSAET